MDGQEAVRTASAIEDERSDQRADDETSGEDQQLLEEVGLKNAFLLLMKLILFISTIDWVSFKLSYPCQRRRRRRWKTRFIRSMVPP